jgi:hypothetical protein
MKLATFLLAAIAALPMFAQTKANIDKPALEAYLRHAELWIPQVAVNIDDPKPFVWSKTADNILASVERFCLRTSNSRH